MATFPLDIRTELKLPNGWYDISDDVYQRDAKRITRGMRELGTSADPSSLTLTLNNRDGKYSRRNPTSPLYGKIGRNTPVRLSVPSNGDRYLQLDGDPDSIVQTPFTAITGDLDIRWEGEPGWYQAEDRTLIGQWNVNGNQRGWLVTLMSGWLRMQYSTDGTINTSYFHDVAIPSDMPTHAAIRITVDTNNGAGGRTVSLYWADSMDTDEWTLFRDSTLTGTVTLNASTEPLQLGVLDVSTDKQPMYGRCTRAEVRNGINGPVVAAPDFRALTAGTTSFTDSAGLVWTLGAGASIRDREDRFMGEISSWPVEWSTEGADVWASVTASGILRRLGQGQKALDSPLRRRLSSADNVVAYWPLEDAAEALSAYSPIPGVAPAELSGVEYASMSDLVSSAPLPRLSDSAGLKAAVPAFTPGAWQVEFVYTAGGSIPADESEVIQIHSKNSTVRRWRFDMQSGLARVRAYNSEGTLLENLNLSIGDDVFSGWTRLRFQCGNNGDGTFDWRLDWQDIGGSAGGFGRAITGTAGSVSALSAAWGSGTNGWGIGHLTVFSATGVTTFDGSDNAYNGEGAWFRLQRVGDEENLPFVYQGGLLSGSPVGFQRTATALELFEDVARADGGLLTEDPRRLGLYYRNRPSLYNQTPVLTLSYAEPGVAPGLSPVDDDTDVRNDVTVQRYGGSFGRAVVETGPMSVEDVGRYDESVTLSLADDTQPLAHACWRAHLGTFDGARYPAVTLTLHKPGAEALIDGVLALREGDVIRITDLPPYVSYDDVDLMVLGWSEELDMYRWEITFTCVPAEPWRVGQTGASEPTRADAEDGESAIAAPATATATTLVVATEPQPWVSAYPVLNVNSSFDNGLDDWNGSGSSLDRAAVESGAPFPEPWAMVITPDGVAEFPNAGSGMIPVSAGSAYNVSGWLRCSRARNVALNVNWFDAAFTYLSTSSNDQAVSAREWEWFEQTATAPAGAVYANIAPTVPDFPPITDVLSVVRPTMRRAGGTPYDFPFDVKIGGEVVTVHAVTPAVGDSFGRTVAGGWGSPDTGGSWSVSGTAADYSVTPGYGAITPSALNSSRLALVPAPTPDVDMYVDVTTSVMPAGNSLFAGPAVRANGNVDLYTARLDFRVAGTVFLTLRKRVAGVETELGSYQLPVTYTAGTYYRVRLQARGSTIRTKGWLATDPEPLAWHISVTDASVAAADSVGVRGYAGSGSTAVSPQLRFANLTVSGPQIMHVTRSVNRVVKAQEVGTGVRLARPSYVAL